MRLAKNNLTECYNAIDFLMLKWYNGVVVNGKYLGT